MNTYFRATPTSVVHLIAGDRTRCGASITRGAKFNASDLPSGERTFRVCKACRA